MMPVGMYGNHCAPGGIARNALLGDGWHRGQSDAESQRGKTYGEFETHVLLSLFICCLSLCLQLRQVAAAVGTSSHTRNWFRILQVRRSQLGLEGHRVGFRTMSDALLRFVERGEK
jgi:hypothetical protein